MPIFVYRCGCGHRFERLVPRDAAAPACPECAGPTRKIPAGPSLARGGGAPSPPRGAGAGGSVPIPWRGVVSGGPEKLRREVDFRQRLEAKARSGIRTPGGPERRASDTGGKPDDAAAPPSG
ncbi:MAG: zinc ribbon domain-containing protein [Dehalococcoidia bacterium]